MNNTFRIADLSDERDQEQVVSLLSSFSLESSHPQPLPEEIRDTICANLREFPVTLTSKSKCLLQRRLAVTEAHLSM